jgi:Anthranilate/para-aminobenzoate synthases component I
MDLDSRIELNLREDTKEKSEHIMLVDLARNDVAKVSRPGTRYVKDLLKVDRFTLMVMHLKVSRGGVGQPLRGRLRIPLTLLLFKALP